MGSTQGIRRGERAESGLDKSLILQFQEAWPFKMLSEGRQELRVMKMDAACYQQAVY